MSKYIIKNCPAILPMTKLCDSENLNKPSTYCQDCTDCALKQIVKKCRKSLEVSYCPIEKEILELLDIEDVE